MRVLEFSFLIQFIHAQHGFELSHAVQICVVQGPIVFLIQCWEFPYVKGQLKLHLDFQLFRAYWIGIQWYRFLSKHCFLCRKKKLISSVFILFKFKIFLDFSWDLFFDWYIKSMIFNLLVFCDFPVIFLLLISSLIQCGLRIHLYYFKFDKVCFMAHDVVYFGD